MTRNVRQFAIVIAERDGSEKRELFGDAPVSIGRVQGNGLVLHRSNVSKRHARLSTDDNRFTITDLGSTNGTYVNRQRITEATAVCEGDRVYVGDFMLRLEWVDADGRALSAAAPEPNSTRWPSIPPGTVDAIGDRRSASESAPPPARASEPPVAAPPSDRDDVRDGVSVSIPSSAAAEFEVADGDVGDVGDVGELVRRVLARVDDGSIDPAAATRRELERCLREEIAATRASDTLGNQARLELFECGFVDALLAEPTVTEIRLSGDQQCEIVRGRELEVSRHRFASPRSYELVVGRLLDRASVTAASGWVSEGELCDGVWRLTALSHGPGSVLRFRRAGVAESDLGSWVARGALSAGAAAFLKGCVSGRGNVLIVSADAEHGAQFADALLVSADCGPCAMLCERPLPSEGREAASGRIQLDDSTLAFPDRLVEIVRSSRGQLVVDALHTTERAALVEAAAYGLSGLVGLVCARRVHSALHRIAGARPADASGSNLLAARETVGAAFDVAVEIASDASGAPVVASIDVLRGADSEGFKSQALFTRDSSGALVLTEASADIGERLAAVGIGLDADAPDAASAGLRTPPDNGDGARTVARASAAT